MERKTEIIDGEIRDLKGTIQDLRASVEEKRQEREKLEERRSGLVFKAVAEGDSKAKSELEKLRGKLLHASLEAEEVELAVVEAGQRLAGLEREREITFRAEKRSALQKEIEAAVQEAKETVPLIAAVVERVERYRERDLRIVGLAREAGFQNAAAFYSTKFLIRAIEIRMDRKSYRNMLHTNDIFLEREVDEILKEFFAGRMNGNGLDSEGRDAPEAENGVGEEAVA